MNILLRVAIILLAVPATFYFVFWIPSSLLGLHDVPYAGPLLSALCAGTVGWMVWTATGSERVGLARSVLLGAVVVGSVGFVGGFFGPMLLAPGANQGPLLGLFVTGPIGAVVGAVGGLAYGLQVRSR